jgi:hypothetical protein
MKTIEEILATPDTDEKISLLKQRKTPLPDAVQLLKDWDSDRHDVMSKEKRPDMKVIRKEGVKDINGNYTSLPEYDTEPVNRIPLPLEQDITNIHTAFTVGIEPKLNCEPNNDAEDELLRNCLNLE